MAFNLFFECKLGSAIFKRTWQAVKYRNYLAQITFSSFREIKKWSIKITIYSVWCCTYEMVGEKIICF